ncbi:NAD(P)-binding domain-containing protein [Agromyces sp. H3Y2-19a]|nr:NAD(P)-binding domain-containing protein [Agromyces chromiiresistens]MDF0512830.1 NAD(P)-binding domain-containing protein [Agromyces chromiiresistens]
MHVDAWIEQRAERNGSMETVTDRPVIGIYGAGKVGTALARLLVAAGYRVLIAGSPRQTALELLVGVVAPGAVVVPSAELPESADVIIVAVPFGKAGTVPWAAFDGRIVVDAMNYWPPVDGNLAEVDADPRTTSEQNAARNPRARVVKSLNHLGYHEMEDDSLPAGDPLRRALAVVGDDPGARAEVAALIDAIGFDPVDGGALEHGVALEPGHPAFGRELSAGELAALLTPAAHLAA